MNSAQLDRCQIRPHRPVAHLLWAAAKEHTNRTDLQNLDDQRRIQGFHIVYDTRNCPTSRPLAKSWNI